MMSIENKCGIKQKLGVLENIKSQECTITRTKS